MLSNLLKFRILNESELKPIFSIYTTEEVCPHETNLEKVAELEKNNFFDIPCEECREKYEKHKKITKTMTVNMGEELVFKGLGWLTVERGPLDIELTIPQEMDFSIRKAFIDQKR